jgi:hypothetical protein
LAAVRVTTPASELRGSARMAGMTRLRAMSPTPATSHFTMAISLLDDTAIDVSVDRS